MATYATANAIGQREDLSDVIYRIDPDETPVFSNAQKEVTKALVTSFCAFENTGVSSGSIL